jgi:hypothetical protein
MRIFIFLLFTLNSLIAQKVVKKSIVDSAITSFQIDVSNCFQVQINTGDSDEIIVKATIDGEYKKDLVLNVREEGKSVFVNAGFRQDFENPNDKLSAHKVVSIALDIQLPEYINVRIFGTSANVTNTAVYEDLKITLNDGTTYLNQVEGKVEVTSQSGNIFVESESAEIYSKSKYGVIDGELIPTGNNKYVLNTVTGNIRLKRIE